MPYGRASRHTRQGSKEPCRCCARRQCRYKTSKWRHTAERVRLRDRYCLIVPGCTSAAEIADHIVRVTPEMPDWLFYDEANLRGGCQVHNKARGAAEMLLRDGGEASTPPAAARGRYSVGHARPHAIVTDDGAAARTVTPTPGPFLGVVEPSRWRLVQISPPTTVIRDYTALPEPAGATRTPDAD